MHTHIHTQIHVQSTYMHKHTLSHINTHKHRTHMHNDTLSTFKYTLKHSTYNMQNRSLSHINRQRFMHTHSHKLQTYTRKEHNLLHASLISSMGARTLNEETNT